VVIVVREPERAADSLFLIAHDPASGRPLVGPRVLGVGLATALLGELVTGGLVGIRDDRVRASDRQPFLRRVRHHSGGLAVMGWCTDSYRRVSPDQAGEPCSWCGVAGVEVFPDRMVWDTRELIARERVPRSVLDWLMVLAADAASLVAQRLAADGWLVAEYRRSLWSGRVVRSWIPVNVVEADASRQALRRIVRDLDQRPAADQWLVAALVDVLQLTRVVVADLPDPAAAAQALSAMASQLDDSLRFVVEHARAAVDNAVVTHTG
jgi:hypothetical protein